jgi:hypothetical protein
MFRKRRPRKVQYKRPVAPPFRYFLTPKEMCLALGISRLTGQRWAKTWFDNDPFPRGIEPIVLAKRKDGSPSVIRYRWENVLRLPAGTWLSRLKEETAQITSDINVATGIN